MNKFKFFSFAIIFVFTLSISAFAQKEKPVEEPKLPENYNAELANEVGADDYGMRSYVFVILKTGKAKIKDEKKRKELFDGHFANMGRLAKEGKLVLAGPLSDEKNVKRGIFILNVTTIEEARELVKTDPSISAGIFDVELIKFYGSAALMKINEIHTTIQKKEM